MSNIKELANVPEISFIENMSLQETEELVRANYTRIFKELTGQDAELGEADAKNLIIKSFSLVLYQVMQYVEAKGRAELLKTSTGDALDALAASGGAAPLADRTQRVIQMACKHAVKGGERLPMESVLSLIRDVIEEKTTPTCPHGRPLMVQISHTELDKRFRRIQG